MYKGIHLGTRAKMNKKQIDEIEGKKFVFAKNHNLKFCVTDFQLFPIKWNSEN